MLTVLTVSVSSERTSKPHTLCSVKTYPASDGTNSDTVTDALSQYDPKDPTSASTETRTRAKNACDEHMSNWEKGGTLAGLRIGIPQEYFPASLSADVIHRLRGVLSALRDAGAELVPVSLPNTKYALSAYYVLASAEASSNLARYDGVQYGTPPRLPTLDQSCLCASRASSTASAASNWHCC